MQSTTLSNRFLLPKKWFVCCLELVRRVDWDSNCRGGIFFCVWHLVRRVDLVSKGMVLGFRGYYKGIGWSIEKEEHSRTGDIAPKNQGYINYILR